MLYLLALFVVVITLGVVAKSQRGTSESSLAKTAVRVGGFISRNSTSTCTVSIFNRTVQVNPDGSWELPNVPAGTGQVKARATCVENGITRSGESAFFSQEPDEWDPTHQLRIDDADSYQSQHHARFDPADDG